ncbi:SIR2 family protein [Vagococcus fluvialis]|uniref:SIR2 family protein n=1 Tax=Vagococcus fluvialis TaxID=2738 RepID=UPI00289237C8|nr:SIR2 family protein [Vagococcus fluvialis]MDT2746572.1 SIR2 family protein [Vagococcus fluvialis]
MTNNIQQINHIINAMNDNSLIIFVGAGISANSGLPSWNQLIGELRKELLLESDEEDNLRVAQFYYDTWGQQKYFTKIMDIFNKHSNAIPNDLHDHILKIQPRHIITTNYDELLEEKINEGITKYDIIKGDFDIPYTSGNRYLIKMHGDLKIKNIVLKENDYLDYESNFYMTSTLIKSLIMNNTILFVGYSLGDTTFNSIYRLIHNNFGEDTKKSYFFTPNKPKEAIVEYYKKKGIHVLSSEKSDVGIEEYGQQTSDFLSKISNNKKSIANNFRELWSQINFLNNFNFVETSDIRKLMNTERTIFSEYPDRINFYPSKSDEEIKEEAFEIPLDSDLMKFLEEKTLISNFLGNNIDNMTSLNSNEVLISTFNLYKENKHNEAKKKFREIANKAYRNKDYLNYMIAEFNVSNIHSSFFEEELILEETVVNIELADVVDSLIENSKQEISNYAVFFKNNILNFNFIFNKIYKINDILGKLKEERYLYKKGGSSSNSYFQILRYEFHSFMNFIEKNCLCVDKYKEFHMVIDNYFESLIIAFDNSNTPNKKDNIFGPTSTIIEAISLDDLKNVIPYMNVKSIPIHFENYSIDKIKITDESFDYIIEECLKLIPHINNHYEDNILLLNKYIKFLSYVEITDYNKIIDLLSEYPVHIDGQAEISILLNIINLKKELISEEDAERVFEIVSNHIDVIISNKQTHHYRNFNLYKRTLLNLKDLIKDTEIFNQSVYDELLFIKNVPNKIKDIEKLKEYICSFYHFLRKEEKQLINTIFTRYSKLPSDKKNYFFIIEIVEAEIPKFKSVKDEVLTFLLEKILRDENEKVSTFPAPSRVGTSHLFNLVQFNYFNKEEIMNKDIEKKMIGKSFVVDWILFNIRTNDVIEGLLATMSFSKMKKVLCTNEKDKKILDEWAIKKLDSGRRIL